MRRVLILAFVCALASAAMASDKKDLADHYKGKFAVVQKDGLAFGLCNSPNDMMLSRKVGPEPLAVRIDGDAAEYHEQTGFSAMGCGSLVPEPLHKGEVVKVYQAIRHGDEVLIAITAPPHQVERGIGAFAHQSYDFGSAGLRFKLGKDASLDTVRAAVDKWLKVFDTEELAKASIGNTASGVYVKEVKVGMTPAEVESALGTPVTRVDLESKLLYKYKDMTVEFHDGKVTDVR